MVPGGRFEWTLEKSGIQKEPRSHLSPKPFFLGKRESEGRVFTEGLLGLGESCGLIVRSSAPLGDYALSFLGYLLDDV